MRLLDPLDEYGSSRLSRADVDPDPVVQFRRWLDEAITGGVAEPHATALATAGADGRPSSRMVLLKSVDARGFVFSTHYASRKGRELDANPYASLVFYWHSLERQVRVEGRVERTSDEESDTIFDARPRGARVGTWISEQSRPLEDRATLEDLHRKAEARFDAAIPRPPGWGGFRLVPDRVELWQGRRDRLHDRLCYRKRGDGWRIERLAP